MQQKADKRKAKMAKKSQKYGGDSSYRFNGENGIHDVVEETENNFYDTSMFGRKQPGFFNRHGDS